MGWRYSSAFGILPFPGQFAPSIMPSPCSPQLTSGASDSPSWSSGSSEDPATKLAVVRCICVWTRESSAGKASGTVPSAPGREPLRPWGG